MCACMFKGHFGYDTLIKCKEDNRDPHFYYETFAKPFKINLLAILTFTPGNPGSPFSPYIGHMQKYIISVTANGMYLSDP